MGATSFTQTGHGATVAEAFNTAHAQVGHEQGYSYSGSLSVKDSFVITDHRVFADLDAAAAYAMKLIHDRDPRVADKWGPAGAVRYVDPEHTDGQSWLFFGMASE